MIREHYEEPNTICPIIRDYLRTYLRRVLETLLADGGFNRRVPLFLLSPEGFTIQIGHDYWMYLIS